MYYLGLFAAHCVKELEVRLTYTYILGNIKNIGQSEQRRLQKVPSLCSFQCLRLCLFETSRVASTASSNSEQAEASIHFLSKLDSSALNNCQEQSQPRGICTLIICDALSVHTRCLIMSTPRSIPVRYLNNNTVKQI